MFTALAELSPWATIAGALLLLERRGGIDAVYNIVYKIVYSALGARPSPRFRAAAPNGETKP